MFEAEKVLDKIADIVTDCTQDKLASSIAQIRVLLFLYSGILRDTNPIRDEQPSNEDILRARIVELEALEAERILDTAELEALEVEREDQVQFLCARIAELEERLKSVAAFWQGYYMQRAVKAEIALALKTELSDDNKDVG